MHGQSECLAKSAGALVTTAGRSDDTALTHSVQILEIAEAVALVGLCFVRSICYLARAAVSTAESNYSAGGKAESISPAYRLRPLYGGKAELKP